MNIDHNVDYLKIDRLKEPIKSEEEFNKCFSAYRLPSLPLSMLHGAVVQAPWWLKREALRLKHVYEMTDVLLWLNQRLPGICAHVSTKDKEMVAYTPDKGFGERDAQLALSPGKLFQKLLPFFTDHAIGEMVAEHKAELTMEVEFFTTGREIADAYLSGAVSSCMAKEIGGFGKRHPSLAYEGDDIKMAVLRNKDGDINARSMVFGKTFIRCYGDEKLKKFLLRNGYRQGSWVGAKFSALPAMKETVLDPNSNDTQHILLPYLDCNGGGSQTIGSTVAYMDGKLVVLDQKMYHAIAALGSDYLKSGSTSGYIYIKPVKASHFQVVDGLTGVTHNRLTVGPLAKVVLNGVVVDTLEATIEAQNQVMLGAEEAEQFPVQLWKKCASGVWAQQTFADGYQTFEDTPAKRSERGFIKLDPVWYPEQQDWIHKRTCVQGVATPGGPETWFRAEDTVRIFWKDESYVPEEGGLPRVETARIHKSYIDKTYRKLHPVQTSVPSYTKDLSIIAKTDTGRSVIPGKHDVIKLWDGQWSFRRGTEQCNVNGTLYHYKGTRPETLNFGGAIYNKSLIERIKSAIADLTPTSTKDKYIQATAVVTNTIRNNIGHPSITVNGRHWDVSKYNAPWADVRIDCKLDSKQLLEAVVDGITTLPNAFQEDEIRLKWQKLIRSVLVELELLDARPEDVVEAHVDVVQQLDATTALASFPMPEATSQEMDDEADDVEVVAPAEAAAEPTPAEMPPISGVFTALV